MRIRLLVLAVVTLFWGAAQAHATSGPNYYLALGDSLSIGIQPSSTGVDVPTTQGYVDDLYAGFVQHDPTLLLTKLGCSGETSTSMIHGGICSYLPAESQLAAAVSFLQTHHVTLITLDIGANDIDNCVSVSGINWTCVTTALSRVGSDLTYIVAELRKVAGRDTPIVAMNYYDPVLAAWTLGTAGQALADESLLATSFFNGVLETVYGAFAVPVADVAQAFHTDNFLPVPAVNLPLNVFLTVTWTWMAAPPPVGPNVHPNAAGYTAIAGAFATKITTVP